MSAPKPLVVAEPPVDRGPGDDPRKAIYISVNDVRVDQNVQRAVLQPRIDRMGKWEYPLAEAPTVSERKDQWIVIEGQGRVLHQQQNNPGACMWFMVVEPDAENYAADEARIARRISGGRTQHTTFDKMSLERTAGDKYWQEATRQLLFLGLEMGSASAKSHSVITAVGAVGTIMHSYDHLPEMTQDESVLAGGELLADTIAVLSEAFGNKQEKDRRGMYDRIMLMVVSGVLLRGGEKIDKLRLAATLRRLTPADWRDESKRHRPGTSALDHLGRQVLDDYSTGKREQNKLTW